MPRTIQRRCMSRWNRGHEYAMVEGVLFWTEQTWPCVIPSAAVEWHGYSFNF